MQTYINKVINGQNLTREEAADAMDKMLGGGATEAQSAALLTALRMKGETIDEIAGCAEKMKEKASHLHPKTRGFIDCVGTGGDCTSTFNISTTAAFVIAGAGVPIAKHGNRAISSKAGSADLLEALGVNIMLEPSGVEKCLDEIGIGFMFARTFNKSMKDISKVRAEIKTRTIFNILGPISNPSDAEYQMIGVFSPSLTNPLASAMSAMGIKHGMVISAVENGMDEISVSGETAVSEICADGIRDYKITPEQFGIERYPLSAISGGNAEENVNYTLSVLRGEGGARRDITALNAGAAIYCANRAASIADGLKMAYESIDSGAAMGKLEQLKKLSNEVE